MPEDSGRLPLEIETVECFPLDAEKVIVRLSGTGRRFRRGFDGREVLVVEAQGRRHRFPSLPESRGRGRLGRSRSFSASFELPSWLEPEHQDGMSLLLGKVTIPLPPCTMTGDAVGAEGGAVGAEPPGGQSTDEEGDAAGATRLAHTVAALRAELHERAVNEEKLRAQLAAALQGRDRAQPEPAGRDGSMDGVADDGAVLREVEALLAEVRAVSAALGEPPG